MSFFITEKQTEDWLTFETRQIPMPDGTTRPFTHFKLMWRSYDYLIVCGKFTGKQLVEQTIQTAKEMNYTFEEAFPNVLSYLHRRLRKAQGID